MKWVVHYNNDLVSKKTISSLIGVYFINPIYLEKYYTKINRYKVVIEKSKIDLVDSSTKYNWIVEKKLGWLNI